MLRDYLNDLDKLKEFRLPQRAYLAIRHAIRNLKLAPGQTILEREMAELLEMSRTPIREALVRLEIEGWVHLVPRRGFIVAPLVADELRQIYEIVEALEGIASQLATKRSTDEQLDYLEKLIFEQEKALNKGDLLAWINLDDQFHNYIVNMANNPRLSGIVESLSDQLYRARLYTISHRTLPKQSVREHKSILSVMKIKDLEAVKKIIQSHRHRAKNEILNIIKLIYPT